MTDRSPRRNHQTVSVVVADAALQNTIGQTLDAAGYAWETFGNARAALDAHRQRPPERSGCLIIDAFLPGMSGLDLQKRLQGTPDPLPVIFVAASAETRTVVAAVRGGAMDFLVAPFERQRLADSAAEALRVDARRRKRRATRADLAERAGRLTRRETQVFERITAGLTNKAVAIDFGISERTVEIHRGRVMRKMLARNIADLVHMKVFLDGTGRTDF